MFGMHLTTGDHKPFDEEVMDQIEGEALIVVENPDRYASLTVEMARKTLDMILRLRRGGTSDPQMQSI
ncbi:hypothetical protein CU669_01930 [Paramagnetospirillum kuznetsovii]|uniref:Uncharacterized protein n=1 Tax=Paramagnetospirillum kuznetsovii TaxID=2053833 RepID=A0A364P3J7_9PROT|nr:hypothetical protein [Paramagnetospirillum kuznetsovii]RAU23860.1 hypothetical protein CU669_01930 [Paramagnetospirillum kuznetsovii]